MTDVPGPVQVADWSLNDRVRVRSGSRVVDGVIWSLGPELNTFWVVPDDPQPDMTQGCIKASLQQLEETTDATLW